MSLVLIVDDELDIQSSLSFALKDEGYLVLTASSPKEALRMLGSERPDVCLFDVWFPDGDGMELLKQVKEKDPQLLVIMMSGHGNIELALRSIRLGAYDFLEKPLELEKVLVVLRNALETQSLRQENQRLLRELWGEVQLIGHHPSVVSLRQSIEKATSSAAPVFVFGEHGTGKELVARAVHGLSPRRKSPFVAVNCSAIPEALFESELFGHEQGSFPGAVSRKEGRLVQSGDGVLFLDEVTELSASSQAKLAHVLEHKSFTRVGGNEDIAFRARIVVASQHDVVQKVKAGDFREDLFYRLNVLPLHVPSLRDRGDDVLEIARHYLRKFASEVGRPELQMGTHLEKWMLRYDWPGNVRELRNLLERMIIMGRGQQVLGLDDLPEELQGFSLAQSSPGEWNRMLAQDSGSLRDLRGQFEKEVIERRLKRFDGNVTKAADSLEVERGHLHRKIKVYSIR